jgi:hypothetical protein
MVWTGGHGRRDEMATAKGRAYLVQAIGGLLLLGALLVPLALSSVTQRIEALLIVAGILFLAGVIVLYVGGRMLRGTQVTEVGEKSVRTTENAETALTYAVVGLFICGPILGPIALFRALQVRRAIRENPDLPGAGKANAAIAVAIVAFALWVGGLMIAGATRARGATF